MHIVHIDTLGKIHKIHYLFKKMKKKKLLGASVIAQQIQALATKPLP